MIRTIFYLLLVGLVIILGIVLLPFAIIIGIGILVPSVVIVVMPLRVIHLAFKKNIRRTLLLSVLLVPWAYFLWPIILHGYVSRTPTGEGPTVNPWVWTWIGLAWFTHEAVYFICKSSKSPEAVGIDTKDA